MGLNSVAGSAVVFGFLVLVMFYKKVFTLIADLKPFPRLVHSVFLFSPGNKERIQCLRNPRRSSSPQPRVGLHDVRRDNQGV